MHSNIDMVDHPPHYNAYSIEVIEVARHCSFDIGNAVKYLMRHLHKGQSEQDLRKAKWYIDDHMSTWHGQKELLSDPDAKRKLLQLVKEYRQQDGSLPGVADTLTWIAFENLPNAQASLAMALQGDFTKS